MLTIQDLSCLGKCSLTVALPVLSAMGCRTTVLPTEILSTHTGFPSPVRKPLTELLVPIADHWVAQGVAFDAICVGYLAGPEQVEAVSAVLDRFEAAVILDPAMADHGKLYSGIPETQIRSLRALCRRCKYLLPNLTEAALLTGLPYDPEPEPQAVEQLLEGVLALGPEAVVITGLRRGLEMGVAGKSRDGRGFFHWEPYVPRTCHGTGDLFTAVFTGALTGGAEVPAAAARAAAFVRRCVEGTEECSPFGVNFEPQLPWLNGVM